MRNTIRAGKDYPVPGSVQSTPCTLGRSHVRVKSTGVALPRVLLTGEGVEDGAAGQAVE